MTFSPSQPRDRHGKFIKIPGWAKYVGPPEKWQDIRAKVNPTGDTMNCSNTTIAFEMQMRGWDVSAQPNSGSDPEYASGCNSMLDQAGWSPMQGSLLMRRPPEYVEPHSEEWDAWEENEVERLADWIKNATEDEQTAALSEAILKKFDCDEGSRGYMTFPWREEAGGGNHIVPWIVTRKKSGELRVDVIEAQKGLGHPLVPGMPYVGYIDLIHLVAGRWDNLKLTQEVFGGLEAPGAD